MSISLVVKYRTYNILWVYLSIDKYLYFLCFVESIEPIIQSVYKPCYWIDNTMVNLFSQCIEAIKGALSIKGGPWERKPTCPAIPGNLSWQWVYIYWIAYHGFDGTINKHIEPIIDQAIHSFYGIEPIYSHRHWWAISAVLLMCHMIVVFHIDSSILSFSCLDYLVNFMQDCMKKLLLGSR